MIKITASPSSIQSAEPVISSKRGNSRGSYARSSSFKIALFLAAPLVLSVSILTFFLNQFNETSLIREIEFGIDGIISALDVWNSPEYSIEDRKKILETIQEEPQGAWYVYYDQDDRIVYQDMDIESIAVTSLVEGLVRFDVPPEAILRGPPLDIVAQVAGKVQTFDDGTRLLVAHSIASPLEIRERMRFLGLITIALMFLLIIISFLISSYVVSRTETIAKTSREIVKTGDLSRRIEVKGNWDDLSNLAGTLNHMLERIEVLLHGVKRVSDNIAHDLRTPLSRIKNHLENLQDHAKNTEDEVLGQYASQLMSETDRLLQTFNALLRIANIESGKLQSDFIETDIQALIAEVVELYEPLAEEKSIRIELSLDSVKMICDPDLLFQAAANILDNAIKFSPADSNIRVELNQDSKRLYLNFFDEGPGIPAAERERVFDRFYRAEPSRNAPGNGLGLSLVHAIIELHKGKIELESPSRGLAIKLDLPLES